MNESWHTHISTPTCSRVYVCHTYEWGMSHIWMSHVTYMNEACHIYKWVMSHIWVSHDTHIFLRRFVHGYKYVTHMNEACHIYEWVHICHTYEWGMSHIWMSHVTYMNESRHTHTSTPTWSRVYVCYTYEWGMSHTWMSHNTHIHLSHLVREYILLVLFSLLFSYCFVRYITMRHLCGDFRKYRVVKTLRMPWVAGHFSQKIH